MKKSSLHDKLKSNELTAKELWSKVDIMHKKLDKKSSLHARIDDIASKIERFGYKDIYVSQLEELFDQTLKEVVGEMEEDKKPLSRWYTNRTSHIGFRNQLRSEILKRWQNLK